MGLQGVRHNLVTKHHHHIPLMPRLCINFTFYHWDSFPQSFKNALTVQFSHSVVSNSFRPHELQHARPPCPSPTPRVYPNPCPSSWWCHPTISSSVVSFSSCPQSFPASGSFHFFKIVCFFFSPFIFISWRLITLQYCSGFCHTLTWTSHGFTCVPHPDPPSHLPLHPTPLGLPSAPALSTCLMHPTWTGDLFHPW